MTSDSSASDGHHPTAPVSKNYIIASSDFHTTKVPIILFAWFLMVAVAKIIFQNIKIDINIEVKQNKEKVSRKILRQIQKFFRVVPESCILISLGLSVGFALIFLKNNNYIEFEFENFFLFDAHVFFIFLLPPIIFEAGYTVPRKAFIMNALEIFVYAVFGTLLNVALVGGGLYLVNYLEWLQPLNASNFTLMIILLYSAINSAVDPVAVLAVFNEIHVNMTLFILVFGESLMNDGVAVVLFNVFNELIRVWGNAEMDAKKQQLSFTNFGTARNMVVSENMSHNATGVLMENVATEGIDLMNPANISETISFDLDHNMTKRSVSDEVSIEEMATGQVTVTDVILHLLYIVFGGLITGIGFGFICAYITKFTRNAHLVEPVVVLGFSYIAYFLAESFKTSAILAMVFCTLTMRSYSGFLGKQ